MITLARVHEALKVFPNGIETVCISNLGAHAHIQCLPSSHAEVRIEYNTSDDCIVTFIVDACHITVANFFGTPDIEVELRDDKYFTVLMTQKEHCNTLFILWKNEVREEIKKFFNV